MLRHYSVCMRGKDHVETGMPLQDRCALVTLPNGWVAAAVADGVGSASRAEVGAGIAVESFLHCLGDTIGMDARDESIHALMYVAFNHAFGRILARAEEDCEAREAYDTTLHAVLFTGGKIHYAHAGDGGIFGMDESGRIMELTTPQKGDDHTSVIPFTHGPDNWVFGVADKPLRSIMLATDGLRDVLMPYLLRGQGDGVYVPLATFFMDPAGILRETEDDVAAAVRVQDTIGQCEPNAFYPYLTQAIAAHIGSEEEALRIGISIAQNNMPLRMLKAVTDDISIVAIALTDEASPPVDPAYYEDPDWVCLQQALHEKLYAPLFQGREDIHFAAEPEEEPEKPLPQGGVAPDEARSMEDLPPSVRRRALSDHQRNPSRGFGGIRNALKGLFRSKREM